MTAGKDKQGMADKTQQPSGKHLKLAVTLPRVLVYGVLLLVLVAGLLLGYATLVEPRWLKIREITLVPNPTLTIVHISDLHYNGDRAYLRRVIAEINRINPDLVCFTGDLVERNSSLGGVLLGLRRIKVPLYGVPGNHDIWYRGENWERIKECFKSTGGAWLDDDQVNALGGKVSITGLSGLPKSPQRELTPVRPAGGAASPEKRLLLIHQPLVAIEPGIGTYNLIMAGHSHGGQVCLPWGLAPALPYGVGEYRYGLFQTVNGPLYVTSGIGTFMFRIRFNCRPEIVVFHL